MKELSVRTRPIERLIESSFLFFASVSIVSIIGITLFLFSKGLPLFGTLSPIDFLFSPTWDPVANIPSFGIFAFIIGSLLVTILSLVMAVPIGVATGVYLSELGHSRFSLFVRSGVELLAGIPSVIYGLFGFFFIAPIVRRTTTSETGLGAFTAGIILAIMILPTIITITEVSLRSVPKEIREGSEALGATRWQTISRTLIPASGSGIIAGIVLGIGRSIGETMAVLMVAGNSPIMPEGLFSHVRTLTMNIVTDLKYAEVGSMHETSLFTTGIILFLFVLVINVFVQVFLKRTITERGK